MRILLSKYPTYLSPIPTLKWIISECGSHPCSSTRQAFMHTWKKHKKSSQDTPPKRTKAYQNWIPAQQAKNLLPRKKKGPLHVLYLFHSRYKSQYQLRYLTRHWNECKRKHVNLTWDSNWSARKLVHTTCKQSSWLFSGIGKRTGCTTLKNAEEKKSLSPTKPIANSST